MGVDAIIALVSLLAPPVIDLAKKLFVKPGKDTPEATMSALATTKPEALAGYVAALSDYLKAQCTFFNRDISGTPAQWVITLRASIRPLGTIAGFVALVVMAIAAYNGATYNEAQKPVIDGLRYTSEAIVSSWFGNRITIGTN